MVDAEAFIDGSAQGWPAGEGKGKGEVAAEAGSGGSHGGTGGVGTGVTHSAVAYDRFQLPKEFGSGGGRPFEAAEGGRGGGIIKLQAATSIEIDGTLTVNGDQGVSPGLGGGSGGSIVIITQNLTGEVPT